MVPANKILTVTYGTFSCTLEGFEDPFTAMTEIAEYFRDLASKDRFFGAEPPTPDMDKLEKIAAASMPGPVEADNTSGRLVLRPGEAEKQPALSVDLVEEIAEDQDVTATPYEDAPATDPVADSAPEDEAEQDSAAMKLARLRDVVVTTDAASEAFEDEEVFDMTETEPELAADETASDVDDVVESDAGVDATIEDAADDAELSEEPVLTDSEPATDSDIADDDEASVSPEMAAVEAPDAPVLAEDEGVEEAVAPQEETAAAMDAAEDAVVEETVEISEIAVEVEVASDATVGDLDATNVEADVSVEETDAQEALIDAADDIAELADAETDAEDDTAEAIEEAETTIEAVVAEAVVAPTDEEEAVDTVSDEIAEDEEDEEDEREKTLTADLAALFSPREEDPEPEAPVSEKAARVTVRKVRKRVRTADRPEEAVPSATTAAAVPPVQDDEEADLMAELAAIEAELARDATGATETDEQVDDEPESTDAALLSELAAIREEASAEPEIVGEDEPDFDIAAQAQDESADDSVDPVDDAQEIEDAETAEAEPNDLERLFAATDSRLTGEDASRRHANISHLKAAVAARRADDTIEPSKSDGSDVYREDLANTVRPRRTASSLESATDQDAADDANRPERGTPLVLISEQRVEDEVEQDAEEAPAPKPEVDIAEGLSKGLRAPVTGDDFEQFAEEVGAVDLPDVLEAAAVFSGSVMGQETFSRPRLLHLAAEAVDDLSREDGLRGFGQLLRDGTIRKVGRGTFTLGTESRFQARASRRAS
ncbi:hypothetical protein N9W17_03545 [Jannaschia sp.]|nr:hypothetical protein [Jannaschia sp.]